MQDLHFHSDDFKNSIEKDFKFLKEATSRNVENFQTSLNLQQTYSSSLCSHVNNIYSKLSELQRQIQNSHTHMNQGDTLQIEAPNLTQTSMESLPLVPMRYQRNYRYRGHHHPFRQLPNLRTSVLPLQQPFNSQHLRTQTGQTQSLYKSLHR